MSRTAPTATMTSAPGAFSRWPSRPFADSADYPLWREFAYEYEFDRLAIDLINGSEILRGWVDDPFAEPRELDALARHDEATWKKRGARISSTEPPPEPACHGPYFVRFRLVSGLPAAAERLEQIDPPNSAATGGS